MLDWLDLEPQQLIRSTLRGWFHVVHLHFIQYLWRRCSLNNAICDTPCVTAKRQDSAPDVIWVIFSENPAAEISVHGVQTEYGVVTRTCSWSEINLR